MVKNPKTFPPIFVISLSSNQARRQYISGELDKHQLKYQIIDAVDGDSLDDKTIDGVYSEKFAVSNFKRTLSKGEIGCALSHLSVYKKILNDNIERAIILEDDAIIGDNFVNVIENINQAAPTIWQLILLGYNEDINGFFSDCQVQVSEPNKSLNFSIKKPLTPAYQTHAYLINQQGAEHLIELIQPLYQPIDHYTAKAKLVSVYCVNPRCVRVNFNLQSSIHTDRELVQKTISISTTVKFLKQMPALVYITIRAVYRLLKKPKCVILTILHHAKFYK